jgi:hypothetical protein
MTKVSIVVRDSTYIPKGLKVGIGVAELVAEFIVGDGLCKGSG